MADPGRRRDDAEVVERLLAPAQEGVALAVALVVAVGVDVEGARVAERVDLDRVVDHQVDRDQRVDLRRVGAELVDRVAHRRQVDDRRHPGEVLHQHARGLERDLLDGSAFASQEAIVSTSVGGHRVAVLEPQRVLEQDLERVRQPGDVELLLQRVEPEDLVLASGDGQRGLGGEGIAHDSEYSPAAATRPRSALVGLPGGDLVGDLGRRRARDPPRELGRVGARSRDERPLAQRRDRDLAAVALDRAGRPPRRPARACRCPSAAARRRPSRRTSRRRGSRPGMTTETPTPRAAQVLAQAEGEAAQAELGRRSRARRARSPPCPRSRRRRRGGRSRARSKRGTQLARHPHRRLEVDAQRAADLLLGEAVEPARGRQRRRWRRGRRSRRPASSSRSASPSSARSLTIVRWPPPGSEPASCSSSAPLRELSTSVAPRRRERLGDRPAEAAGRAGEQRGLAVQIHAPPT